jgi:hypothetical protein
MDGEMNGGERRPGHQHNCLPLRAGILAFLVL